MKRPSALSLYPTVFWFWPSCISKKTVRNTVTLPATNDPGLFNALLIPFVI
jgi:hypothetical protein